MTISQQILLIGSLLTPFAPSTFAQQAAQTDPAQARPVVYSQLPESNGAWVVHVTRTGGFAGIWMALPASTAPPEFVKLVAAILSFAKK